MCCQSTELPTFHGVLNSHRRAPLGCAWHCPSQKGLLGGWQGTAHARGGVGTDCTVRACLGPHPVLMHVASESTCSCVLEFSFQVRTSVDPTVVLWRSPWDIKSNRLTYRSRTILGLRVTRRTQSPFSAGPCENALGAPCNEEAALWGVRWLPHLDFGVWWTETWLAGDSNSDVCGPQEESQNDRKTRHRHTCCWNLRMSFESQKVGLKLSSLNFLWAPTCRLQRWSPSQGVYLRALLGPLRGSCPSLGEDAESPFHAVCSLTDATSC